MSDWPLYERMDGPYHTGPLVLAAILHGPEWGFLRFAFLWSLFLVQIHFYFDF